MMASARAGGGTTKLDELTSLRFIAAFGVVVLHYRDLLPPLSGAPWRLLIGAQYGVTFFFVLSGFVLTYRYADWFETTVGDRSYWTFFRLRLARLAPMYVVGLALDTPWHLIDLHHAGQLQDAANTYWASWLLNLVGLQAWTPSVPFAMFWNTPAWSVSDELFFYATFPFVCAWLAARRPSPRTLLVLIAGAVLLDLALYGAVVYALTYLSHPRQETFYILTVYNPLLRYTEFFAGCLAAQWFRHAQRNDGGTTARGMNAVALRRNVIAAIALAAIFCRVLMPEYRGPSQWLWLLDVAAKYPIFVVPFAMLILAIASGPTFLTPLLRHPVLVLLGEASYSLYIMHWSMTTMLRVALHGTMPSPWVPVLLIGATTAASVACYRYIERPWQARLRGSAGANVAMQPVPI